MRPVLFSQRDAPMDGLRRKPPTSFRKVQMVNADVNRRIHDGRSRVGLVSERLFLRAARRGGRLGVSGTGAYHRVMTRVFAVANQKGGVAKTTTVHSLGSALAERGRRVLLVDLDPQACLTFSLGVEPGGRAGRSMA